MKTPPLPFSVPRWAALALLAVAAAMPVPVRADAEPSLPNILFIVSDDLQACMGAYENPVCQTPNLDRLASEGVRFSNAYCQYPVCGPSRNSFMSGLYPGLTRMKGNKKALGAFHLTNEDLAEHPSIGQFLKEHGYFSARVSKIYHMGVPGGIEAGEPGGDDPDTWDVAFNVLAPETYSQGLFELLTPNRLHYGSNFASVIVPNELDATQADSMAATQAIAILENRVKGTMEGQTNHTKVKPGQPFFLAVGLVRPHVPLVAPQRFFDLYSVEDMKLPAVPEGDLDDVPEPARAMNNEGRYDMDELQQRKALAAYYASVSFMDWQVGRLLDALDRLDLRKNTIVVFISDHGYNLGEHHCWQKLSLFEDSTRVPLIVSAPGFEASAGQTSGAVVELIDLYPTFADLTGLKDQAPAALHGTSLRPLLENPTAAEWTKDAAYTVTHLKGESLRTSRWRYNYWGDAGEELYDHLTDPGEFENLAGYTEHMDTLNSMRALLEKKRTESQTLKK